MLTDRFMRTDAPTVVHPPISPDSTAMPTQPTTPRFVRHTLFIFTAPAMLIALSGCASYQHIPETAAHTTTPTQSLVASTSETDELSELWLAWWPQTSIHQMQKSTDSHAGPSLVAGDWLAWQCAHAGGYFETQPDTFASAFIEID